MLLYMQVTCHLLTIFTIRAACILPWINLFTDFWEPKTLALDVTSETMLTRWLSPGWNSGFQYVFFPGSDFCATKLALNWYVFVKHSLVCRYRFLITNDVFAVYSLPNADKRNANKWPKYFPCCSIAHPRKWIKHDFVIIIHAKVSLQISLSRSLHRNQLDVPKSVCKVKLNAICTVNCFQLCIHMTVRITFDAW